MWRRLVCPYGKSSLTVWCRCQREGERAGAALVGPATDPRVRSTVTCSSSGHQPAHRLPSSCLPIIPIAIQFSAPVTPGVSTVLHQSICFRFKFWFRWENFRLRDDLDVKNVGDVRREREGQAVSHQVIRSGLGRKFGGCPTSISDSKYIEVRWASTATSTEACAELLRKRPRRLRCPPLLRL